MRLLRLDAEGQFSQYEFTGKAVPAYAILSHTWGADDQEVSFEDIRTGSGAHKDGYIKLHFCASQAKKDGLEYFWIDTCCIDKSSSTELQEAINSMFRWYRDAKKCYAYLVDVPAGVGNVQAERATFRKSKWFTRGWTLQELLAPESVDFFSVDGQKLGDKQSLCDDIHEITNIPSDALQGGSTSMSRFSVKERLSWAAGRETKREEDAAYCLLGLFDLAIPLVYGEGREKAFRRLHQEREAAAAYERVLASRHDGVDRADSEIKATVASQPSNPLKRTASQAFGGRLEDSRVLNVFSEESTADSTDQRVEQMQMWWDEAVATHLDPPDEYHKIAVLMLKWRDHLDELGVSRDVSELEAVFRDRFRLHTEVTQLDVSSKPQHQLDRHMSAFIEKYDGPHTLLIVFYSGHSRYNDLYGRLELSASADPTQSRGISQSAVVSWRRAEDMLSSDEVDSDVLILLDATYTTSMFEFLKTDTGIRSTKRLYEMITACPPDANTFSQDAKSFTRALTDTLTDLANTSGSRPFSTTQINQRIRMMSNRKSNASQLWSLFPNERHIALSPTQKKETSERRVAWPSTPGSYLKLGLAFRDDHLNKEQIELLTRHLATALKNKRILGLRKFDWLGIEIRPAVKLEQTAWAKTAIARWRNAVQRNRRQREINALRMIPAENGSRAPPLSSQRTRAHTEQKRAHSDKARYLFETSAGGT